MQEIADKIRPVLLKYGITKADIFGSAARGEMHSNSDIDILVETPSAFGLFKMGNLYLDLKDLLNTEVDLVTYRSVHPYIKKYVYENIFSVI